MYDMRPGPMEMLGLYPRLVEESNFQPQRQNWQRVRAKQLLP
jgi:hypothetical protein